MNWRGWIGLTAGLLGWLGVQLSSGANGLEAVAEPHSARWEMGGTSLFRSTSRGQYRLRWKTDIEAGVVGFDVLSWQPDGHERALNDGLIAARNSAAGGEYSLDFAVADEAEGTAMGSPDLALRIWGEDGRSSCYRLHPVIAEGPDFPELGTDLKESFASPTVALPGTPVRSAILMGADGVLGFDAFTGPAGVYGATANELAVALNLPIADVRTKLLNHTLGLMSDGQPLLWSLAPGQDGCLFYLPEKRTLYQRGNVVQSTDVASAALVIGPPGVPSGKSSVLGLVEKSFENDALAVTTLPGGTEDDFWVGDNFLGTHAVLGTRTYPFVLPGIVTNAGDSRVTVDLASVSEATHIFEATLNGRKLGSITWVGRQWQSWTLPVGPADLLTGTNQLILSSKGDRTSLCYLDRYHFRYARSLIVSDGSLVFELDSPAGLGVRSNDGRAVALWDVTVPTAPWVMVSTGSRVAGGGDTNLVTEFSGQAGHRYVAFRPAAPQNVLQWQTVVGSTLKTEATAVDYLLVTTDALRPGAQRLAAWRESQGLASRVVSLTQIQHEFSDGVPRPDALRGLLAYARIHWQRVPRYVVLVGDGTYDYRHLQGGADNLVPPPLVMTSFGRAAADPQFLDVATANTSIGRLAVKSAGELNGLIDRMMAYETSVSVAGLPAALLLADQPDAGGDFIQDSDTLAAAVAGSLTVRKVYNTGGGTTGMSGLVREALKAGVTWWNYLGHGGRDRMGTDYVTISDVPGLNFGGVAPLVTGMTCAMGQFALPGLDCLGEALLLKNASGPLAIWSPSGFSANYQASQLNRLFAEELTYARRGDRLGDVLRRSRDRFLANGGDAITTEFYNLLGDPALKVPIFPVPLAPELTVQAGAQSSDPPEMSVLGEIGSRYRIEAMTPGIGATWELLDLVRVTADGSVRAPIFLDARFPSRIYRARRE